jgi:hypothetical protein
MMRPINTKIEDIAAITRIINQYALAIDLREWTMMDEVFHPEGEIVMGEWRFTAARGVAHIRECIERCSLTHHANSNIMVDVNGDRARATTYVRAWHRGGPGDGQSFECVGQYLDELVRTPVGWRISRRDERVELIQGDFALFAGLEESRDRLLAESAADFAAR